VSHAPDIPAKDVACVSGPQPIVNGGDFLKRIQLAAESLSLSTPQISINRFCFLDRLS
jgi:hypothetical protein